LVVYITVKVIENCQIRSFVLCNFQKIFACLSENVKKMRWESSITSMQGIKNWNIIVRRQLEGLDRDGRSILKCSFQVQCLTMCTVSPGSRYRAVVGSYEDSNEPSSSIQGQTFPDQTSSISLSKTTRIWEWNARKRKINNQKILTSVARQSWMIFQMFQVQTRRWNPLGLTGSWCYCSVPPQNCCNCALQTCHDRFPPHSAHNRPPVFRHIRVICTVENTS
jgi:hypothetical protein